MSSFTSHARLLSTRTVAKSGLRCAARETYTPDFEELLQKNVNYIGYIGLKTLLK